MFRSSGFTSRGSRRTCSPGELATSQTFWGGPPTALPRCASERTAPPFWLGRANRELDYANYWAISSNPISCAGALAKAALQGAHARLAHRGTWALNEKRMVQWADLTGLYGRFASLGSSEADMILAISNVREAVSDIETEVSGRL